MFKVSFKESPKNSYKIVTNIGNETTVLLKGIVGLPAFWKYMPEEICEWAAHQTHVEAYEDIAKNQLIIYSKGTARCHPEDKYDTVLGERVAESRAKEFIYLFLHGLCTRLYDYYGRIMFGSVGKAVKGDGNSLVKAVDKYERLLRHERSHQDELLKGRTDGE